MSVFIGPLNGAGNTVQTNVVVGQTVVQNNTFSAGQVVRFDPASDEFVLAQADTAEDSEWVGMVYQATGTSFTLIINGWIDLSTSGLSFLPGNCYYLSDTVPGALQPLEPNSPSLSAPVFISITPTAGIIRNHRVVQPTPSTAQYQSPTIDVVGGIGYGVSVITASQTLNNGATTWLVDATLGPVTVTLPSSVTGIREVFNIKKIDATNNVVTIATTGSDLLDGEPSLSLWIQNQGYTIQAVSSYSAWVTLNKPQYGKFQVLVTGLNFNTTIDQAINIPIRSYIVRRVTVKNASVSLTTAAGGIYTGASKTGQALVDAGQTYSTLITSAYYKDLTLDAALAYSILTAQQVFLSLTAAQGSAATADVIIDGDVVLY